MAKFFLNWSQDYPPTKAPFLPTVWHGSNLSLCLIALLVPKASFHVWQFQGPGVLASTVVFSHTLDELLLFLLQAPHVDVSPGQRGGSKWWALGQLLVEEERASQHLRKIFSPGWAAWPCPHSRLSAPLRAWARENMPMYFLQNWCSRYRYLAWWPGPWRHKRNVSFISLFIYLLYNILSI